MLDGRDNCTTVFERLWVDSDDDGVELGLVLFLFGCGCGGRRRGDESVPERRGNEIIKNVKKNEYFIK